MNRLVLIVMVTISGFLTGCAVPVQGGGQLRYQTRHAAVMVGGQVAQPVQQQVIIAPGAQQIGYGGGPQCSPDRHLVNINGQLLCAPNQQGGYVYNPLPVYGGNGTAPVYQSDPRTCPRVQVGNGQWRCQ